MTEAKRVIDVADPEHKGSNKLIQIKTFRLKLNFFLIKTAKTTRTIA